MKGRHLFWTREAIPTCLELAILALRQVTHSSGHISDQSTHCREGSEERDFSTELAGRFGPSWQRSTGRPALSLVACFSVTRAVCGDPTTGKKTTQTMKVEG